MDAVAILGFVGLLFVKECGLPIPVPGDLLVLGAGVATGGDLALAAATLALVLVAGWAGGVVQFLLARGALRRVLLGILGRVGVSAERLDRLAELLRRRGTRGVAVARVTPGVRVGAIAASGLAALPVAVFVPGLVVGNAVFVGGHFALGWVVGQPAIDLVAGSGAVGLGVAAFVVLMVVGAVGWAALRRRTGERTVTEASATALGAEAAAPEMRAADDEGTAYGAWADAACPACLAITLVRVTRA